MPFIHHRNYYSKNKTYINDVKLAYILYSLKCDNSINLTIRNTGSVPVVIQTIYVYKGDTQIFKIDELGFAIAATKMGSVGLRQSDATWGSLLSVMTAPDKYGDVTYADRLIVSAAYTIKVVTDNGFTTEGTYYTPSAFA